MGSLGPVSAVVVAVGLSPVLMSCLPAGGVKHVPASDTALRQLTNLRALFY